jgi:hypothetical protein
MAIFFMLYNSSGNQLVAPYEPIPCVVPPADTHGTELIFCVIQQRGKVQKGKVKCGASSKLIFYGGT